MGFLTIRDLPIVDGMVIGLEFCYRINTSSCSNNRMVSALIKGVTDWNGTGKLCEKVSPIFSIEIDTDHNAPFWYSEMHYFATP